METILIWLGSGFAFGAGLVIGMILMALGMKSKKPDGTQQFVNEMLRQRNEIGRHQVEALERIADSAEKQS